MTTTARTRALALGAALTMALSLLVALPADAQSAGHGERLAPQQQEGEDPEPAAFGFSFVKAVDQITCSGTGFFSQHFSRNECGYADFRIEGVEDSATVQVELVGPDGGDPFTTIEASHVEDNQWTFSFSPGGSWPAGEITARVVVDDIDGPLGSGTFSVNRLGATAKATDKESGEPYAPGEDIPVTGSVYEINDLAGGANTTGVAAEFELEVAIPGDERRLVPGGPFTAGSDGTFSVTVPGSLTSDVTATQKTGFETSIGLHVVNATYSDPLSGAWAVQDANAGGVTLYSPPDTLLLENRYVSSTGWVKPGERYPFRVFVRNYTDADATGTSVEIPAPPSASFTDAVPLNASGTANVAADGSSIQWDIGTLPAAEEGVASVATLVVEAEAATLEADPEIVWKDLSSTATLTYTSGPGGLSSESHGPKVIPPSGGFETARYGDKPFPMVPVDYTDRKHISRHSGQDLERAVNDPNFVGSTFNLYQEMSYGQLYPEGRVPSLGIASADFEYEQGFEFTTADFTRGCRGQTFGEGGGVAVGTPLYSQRISDGFYQLPGNTEYYGGDYPVFNLGLAGGIDSACGPLGKGVYDAAQIADPEIDYNDFDSDKDGVVDFFMMVFVGCGGNGASQVPALCPYDEEPYDNIWPHSSSLEMQFRDEDTGLRGYVSDDQLTDLEGTPQCWIDDTYKTYDDCASAGGNGDDELPTFVRVGPYNVNPETAIDSASVISHEYGHHLGLPDFYSSYNAYADMNLMAADYSQHMTIFSKQDLGWVVPDVLQPGETRDVNGWEEIKTDTGEITWQTPAGEPYTLSEANGDQNIHNGEAYGVKLPKQQVIDPAKVEEQASAPHIWYSGRGNDFGCPPDRGHSLDVYLPELSELAEDTTVTVTFKSSWDIEWDWDYGFVMTSPDGETYTSQPSENGYTTENSYNPNNQQCFSETNNGITGTSGSYESGTETVDRNPAAPSYSAGSPFLEDAYDISELAGADNPVLRFSYFTDAAFDRPGWFIDDIVVTAGDETIYESDFEEGLEEGRLFPGGCGEEGFNVAAVCTAGWGRFAAGAGDPSDHAYYLELRDQAGFDFDGHDQSERGDTSWAPGVLIEYTDENHGYGNNGVPQPPPQHYLDSQPIPGSDCGDNTGGNCSDASFTAVAGDNHFDDHVDDDDGPWVDNFSDPSTDSGNWEFGYGCLSLDVTSLSGDSGNSAALPADLSADATIAAGEGCIRFEYGLDSGLVGEPEACGSQVPPVAFDDVRTSFHRDNIACLAWYTITVGSGDVDGDGRPEYLPQTSLTRAQLASFLARLAREAGVELPTDAPDAFGDDGDSVHEANINALAQLGVIEGRGDTDGDGREDYDPRVDVRRDQMASLVARLLELARGEALPDPTDDHFDDDDGNTHERRINQLADLGIVEGVGGGRYEPTEPVTRAQMATFLIRALNILVSDGLAWPGGAFVELAATSAAAGESLNATVHASKRLDELSVRGCDVPETTLDVQVGDDFSVRIPAERESGPCALTFTATTSRGATTSSDDPSQTVSHTYRIDVTNGS